jgi:acetoin utilization deacetylase AcuC-like enzyme
MKPTAIVWSDNYLAHDTGPHHPERPGRLAAIHACFQAQGVFKQALCIEPGPCDLQAVQRVHSLDYIRRFEKACVDGVMDIDSPDCPVSSRSYDVALLAAGGAVNAVDTVMAGKARNAFCIVRPPGHHAEHHRAMGFCFFNNIAIAAEHLRTQHHLSRIAILDWDVHHGNGTQHHFEADPDVFVCSIHQHPYTLFPGTGFEWERGKGAGIGATLNVPMLAGSTDEEYHRGFERQILPAIREFAPEFVLISAGFDAHEADPLAQIELSTGAFRWMTERAMEVSAAEPCHGRIVSMLEGGYDLDALAQSAQAHVEALMEHTP